MSCVPSVTRVMRKSVILCDIDKGAYNGVFPTDTAAISVDRKLEASDVPLFEH